MSEPHTLIKCLNCKAIFHSPIHIGDIETYKTAIMAGNIVNCPKCGKMTNCNKENMIFNDGAGGIDTGEDTIPKG